MQRFKTALGYTGLIAMCFGMYYLFALSPVQADAEHTIYKLSDGVQQVIVTGETQDKAFTDYVLTNYPDATFEDVWEMETIWLYEGDGVTLVLPKEGEHGKE